MTIFPFDCATFIGLFQHLAMDLGDAPLKHPLVYFGVSMPEKPVQEPVHAPP